jgi:hypothetical protein
MAKKTTVQPNKLKTVTFRRLPIASAVARLADSAPSPVPITGYRQLTQSEIHTINAIKWHASKIGKLVEVLREGCGDSEALRWVSLGKTHLQQGFMALTRAVAQPESF